MTRKHARATGSDAGNFGTRLALLPVLITAAVLLFVIGLTATPMQTFAQRADAQQESSLQLEEIRFSGNTVFSERELQMLLADAIGSQLTFDDLDGLVARITLHYRSAGYVGSQAYVPPQQIEDGVLQIAIVEGRYGEIVVSNNSRLRNEEAHRYFASLTPGSVIAADDLQNRMEALTGLPGVQGTSALAPGAEQGTADVIVTIVDGPRFGGSVDVDNTGSRYVGQPRAGLTFIANNVGGHGDRLILRATSSGGPEFFHGHIGYGGPLPRMWASQVWPVEIGLSYNRVEYKLVEEFKVLEAGGWASTLAASLEVPLIVKSNSETKSRLDLTVDYAHKDFEEKQGPTASATRQIGMTGVGLAGTRQGNAQQRWKLTASSGELTLNSSMARLLDMLTAKTAGQFYKVNADYSATLRLSNNDSLHASMRAQWASKNLDTSEKMSLGGAGGVRAYPSGDSSGDDALVATVEWRRVLLAGPSGGLLGGGRLQGSLFADYGHSLLYKKPWGPGGGSANERTLLGAGLGFTWIQHSFSMAIQHAWRLGTEAATADTDADGRLWLNLSYRF